MKPAVSDDAASGESSKNRFRTSVTWGWLLLAVTTNLTWAACGIASLGTAMGNASGRHPAASGGAAFVLRDLPVWCIFYLPSYVMLPMLLVFICWKPAEHQARRVAFATFSILAIGMMALRQMVPLLLPWLYDSPRG